MIRNGRSVYLVQEADIVIVNRNNYSIHSFARGMEES